MFSWRDKNVFSWKNNDSENKNVFSWRDKNKNIKINLFLR